MSNNSKTINSSFAATFTIRTMFCLILANLLLRVYVKETIFKYSENMSETSVQAFKTGRVWSPYRSEGIFIVMATLSLMTLLQEGFTNDLNQADYKTSRCD